MTLFVDIGTSERKFASFYGIRSKGLSPPIKFTIPVIHYKPPTCNQKPAAALRLFQTNREFIKKIFTKQEVRIGN